VAIKLTCPECGSRIKAPDERAGKRGKCPECGERVRLPEHGIEDDESSASGVTLLSEPETLYSESEAEPDDPYMLDAEPTWRPPPAVIYGRPRKYQFLRLLALVVHVLAAFMLLGSIATLATAIVIAAQGDRQFGVVGCLASGGLLLMSIASAALAEIVKLAVDMAQDMRRIADEL
jgi:hypothetical protein